MADLAAIHDRMPVLLADRDAEQAWLEADLGAQDALADCGVIPQERLTASPADPALDRVGAAPEGPPNALHAGASARADEI